jgi:hypothetical protein
MTWYTQLFGTNTFRIKDKKCIKSIDTKRFKLKDDSCSSNFEEIIVENNEKAQVMFIGSIFNSIIHCGVIVCNKFIIKNETYKYMLILLDKDDFYSREEDDDTDETSLIKFHFVKFFDQCIDAFKTSTTIHIKREELKKTFIEKSNWIEISGFLKKLPRIIKTSVCKKFEMFDGFEDSLEEIRERYLNVINDIKFIEYFAEIYGINVPVDFRKKVADYYIKINPLLDIHKNNLEELFCAIVACPVIEKYENIQNITEINEDTLSSSNTSLYSVLDNRKIFSTNCNII